MGHPNEDLLRKGYQAFGAGDMDTIGELFADDIKWHTPGRSQLSGDLAGKDAVFGLFAKTVELTGGTFKIDVHDLVANDEHAVALVTTQGEREGKKLRDNQVHVYHLQGGKVVEYWGHPGDQYATDEFWG